MTAINTEARVSFGAAALICLIALFAGAQYLGGETFDERIHLIQSIEFWELIRNILGGERDLDFRTLAIDMEFYGIVPIVPYFFAEIVNAALGLSGGTSVEVLSIFIHFSAFFAGLATCALVGLCVFKLTRSRIASVCAGTFLLIYPVWLGHSFFNFKDMTLALYYTLATYGVLVCAANKQEKFARGIAILAFASIAAAGVKLAALPLLVVHWAAVTALAAYPKFHKKNALAIVVAGAAVLMGTYVITPPAWLEPVAFVIEALEFMAAHPWSACMITFGEYTCPNSEEWSTLGYLTAWLSVRLPLAIIFISPLAIIALLVNGGFQGRFIVLTMLFPLIAITARNSTLYDGIRHTLFLFPALMIIVFTAIWYVRDRARPIFVGAFASLTATFALFVADNVALYPHNYVYFNLLGRQIAAPEAFDLDYWGFSLKEASRRTEHLDVEELDVWVGNPGHLVTPFMPKTVSMVDATSIPAGEEYLMISYTRTMTRPPANCTRLASISRQLPFAAGPMELAFVARCTADTDAAD